jgi:hypothetical protein
VGKWDKYHETVFPYGVTTTYHMGAVWLADQTFIEEWGCGPGWFKGLLPRGIQYRGIDGSKSPNVDAIVDLETYRSDVPALFIRHVFEHNYEWKAILQNALASFRNKLFIVLFTPLHDGPTRDIRIHFNHAEVPDLSFNETEFTDIIRAAGCAFTKEVIRHGAGEIEHGIEIVLKVTR